VESCREKYGVKEGAPILALCPGAEFGTAKRWPPEHYARLAGYYLERGWRVQLFGSDNDRPVCRAIREACGADTACQDLAGETSLAEAVDLLSLASAVVSNDSGLMHIAAALERPLVAVYGVCEILHRKRCLPNWRPCWVTPTDARAGGKAVLPG
jgi:heptosyltransferase-2